MTAYLHCPAGICSHREEYDPAHQTAAPEIPADGDRASDEMREHLAVVHDVPASEIGQLLSQVRRTTTIPGGPR